MQLKKELVGAMLMLLFVGFSIGGVLLINVTFTIAPFTIYGEPVPPRTINVGFVMLMLAALFLALILARRRRS